MATRTLPLSFVRAMLTEGRIPAVGEELQYGGRWWVVATVNEDRDIIVLED